MHGGELSLISDGVPHHWTARLPLHLTQQLHLWQKLNVKDLGGGGGGGQCTEFAVHKNCVAGLGACFITHIYIYIYVYIYIYI